MIRIFECSENTLTNEEPICTYYKNASGSMEACDHRTTYNAYCTCKEAKEEALEKERNDQKI